MKKILIIFSKFPYENYFYSIIFLQKYKIFIIKNCGIFYISLFILQLSINYF